MGRLPNSMRPHEQRLPLYQNHNLPTKERYSNDGYYASDCDSESSIAPFSHESRSVSGSLPSHSPLISRRRRQVVFQKPGGLYPYRLPPKFVRYAIVVVVGLIVLMILSLIRASQVENWKVANGNANSQPPPPPAWDKFKFLERYYGGIRTLVSFSANKPEYPRPNELVVPSNLVSDGTDAAEKADKGMSDAKQKDFPASSSWESFSGRIQDSNIQQCFLDVAGTIRPPPLQFYNGRPSGFPEHVIGSYEIFKLPEKICFERYGKLGPYGFGYSSRTGGLGTGENGENKGAELVWDQAPRVDYRAIDWANVQRRCFQANARRYRALPAKTTSPNGFYIAGYSNPKTLEIRDIEGNSTISMPNQHEAKPSGSTEDAAEKFKAPDSDKANHQVEKTARTAIVLRSWDDYIFREDDIANLRSMIAELSMASGGRYDIHLLVQVKNDAQHPIWADHEIYEQRIRDVIPKEFQGLVTLWTETQMLALYQGIYDLYSRGPGLPVHGVYRGLTMAMQHFAYMHPEYDYFWQWEMDVRYIGHYHDFLSKLEDWAKAQPRKGLWERNARYYFPSVHGSWEDFSQMSRVQSEMGAVGADNVWKNIPAVEIQPPDKASKKYQTVWGPVRPADENDWFEPEKDPSPPTTIDADRYIWGVGEEADLISLNPIFDPEGTTWLLKDDITGYNSSLPLPSRRASIITTSRMSRRLLMTMHKTTAHKKQFAFPEMWPSTVALQHGFKAVFAPHPLYVDRKWPLDYMAQTFNGGRDGATGGSRTSLYGDREHNLRGLSWFYNSGFGPNLYRRWLGLKVNNDGGEEFEKAHNNSMEGAGVGAMAGGEGRMCLPPMLLHPVKDVELPVETSPQDEPEVEEELVESDPIA